MSGFKRIAAYISDGVIVINVVTYEVSYLWLFRISHLQSGSYSEVK